jgi:uncharacterized membrane protein
MSKMDNAAYRKSRGTDKPFSSTEEQTKAIWNEQIRREKYQYKRPDSPPEAAPKG